MSVHVHVWRCPAYPLNVCVCVLISHPIQHTEPNKINVDETHPTLYDLSISWSVNGRFTIGGENYIRHIIYSTDTAAIKIPQSLLRASIYINTVFVTSAQE